MRMATYRVGFDGRWQESFKSKEKALEWAEAVSRTGRFVWVAERRWLQWHFVTAFPEDRREAARKIWTGSSGHIPTPGPGPP